ncbi:unnamed protein product [Pseudo-nitzschia multistriata]|uniref:Uncharacterized protein n=1 Tax=Pseudo-nitzschia multistriata TaxID=183589 RepID=A0A448YU79_9STRA|nr:unnamed protein product [Pseudo-nitzschia multistriata]
MPCDYSNIEHTNSSEEEEDESRKKRGSSTRKNESEHSKKVRSDRNISVDNTSCGSSAKTNALDDQIREGRGEQEAIPTPTSMPMDSDSSSMVDTNANVPIATTSSRTDDRSHGSNHSYRTFTTNEQQEKQRHQWGEIWDLESALLYLVQLGTGSRSNGYNNCETKWVVHNEKDRSNTNKSFSKKVEVQISDGDANRDKDQDQSIHRDDDSKSDETAVVREYLTPEKNSWIRFRAAHAGDASSIAQWYRRKRSEDGNHDLCPSNSSTMESTTNYETTHDRSDSNVVKEEEVVSDQHEDPEIDKHAILRNASTSDDESSSDRQRQGSTRNEEEQERHIPHGGGEEKEGEAHSSSLQLEHWLAEGLGDENTCPCVYGLLAYVHRLPNETTGKDSSLQDTAIDNGLNSSEAVNLLPLEYSNGSTPCHDDQIQCLAAVVLLSLSWTSGKRNLRIEWMSIDANQLQTGDEALAVQQKIWLRIHTLSVMTACEAIDVDEFVLCTATTTSALQQQSILSSSAFEEEPLNDGNRTKRRPKNDVTPQPTRIDRVVPSPE